MNLPHQTIDRAGEAQRARLAEIWRKRQAEEDRINQILSAKFADLPSKPCKFHPDILRSFDLERTRFNNFPGKEPEPYMTLCPRCIEERSALDQWVIWRKSGLPAAFFRATLEELTLEVSIIEQLRTFQSRPTGSLILTGPPGLGKTHAACSILQSQASGLFTSHSRLVADHRKTYSDYHSDDIRTRCMEASLLIVDEIGRSVGGADTQPLLHDIFDSRYSDGLATVLVTNCTKDELRERLGEPIADRLRGSLTALVEFKGSSHRGTGIDRYTARLEFVRQIERHAE